MKTAAFALAIASFAATAASAQTFAAALDSVAPAPVVRYADLDLIHPEGARILASRIAQAAHAFCGPEPRPVSLGEYFRYRTCVSDSATRVVQRIDVPQVTLAFARDNRSLVMAGR